MRYAVVTRSTVGTGRRRTLAPSGYRPSGTFSRQAVAYRPALKYRSLPADVDAMRAHPFQLQVPSVSSVRDGQLPNIDNTGTARRLPELPAGDPC